MIDKEAMRTVVLSAMNEGQKCAFQSAVDVCRRIAMEFTSRGAQTQADTANVCAELIEALGKQIDEQYTGSSAAVEGETK